MEEWKIIPNTNEMYMVSNQSRVKTIGRYRASKNQSVSWNKEKIITPHKDRYWYINIGQKRKLLHRIIAEVWIPNPENKPDINHKSGDKLDCRIQNLEWVTKSENSLHAIETGLMSSETLRKLTIQDVKNIRDMYIPNSKDKSIRNIARLYNVDYNCIYGILKGKTYKNVI